MRVGDAPPRTGSSSNTTRIFLQDDNIYFGSRPPAPERKSNDPQHDGGSFGVVWVNAIGREAMASEKPAKFPEGSVIVREKFARQDDKQPELLAVMVKRNVGFNSKSGDWEYLIVDGGLTKIRERKKKVVAVPVTPDKRTETSCSLCLKRNRSCSRLAMNE